MTLLLAACLLVQKSPAELAELRKYRYGKTAAQVEAMGAAAYDRFFNAKTPDADAGFMRGVAYAVFVDAYRENTGRRYRASLPPDVQTRLLALDKQLRFLGVLFARNDWLFTGGNAVDPDGDALEYAQAERQLYTAGAERPDGARMRKRLATYRTEIRAKARRERLFGNFGTPEEGRKKLEANLASLDRALRKADGLCRSARERAVVVRFVADQAVARM